MTTHYCRWDEEEDGTYTTECGDCWDATIGAPALHAITFCPCCGRHVKAVAYRPKDVEP